MIVFYQAPKETKGAAIIEYHSRHWLTHLLSILFPRRRPIFVRLLVMSFDLACSLDFSAVLFAALTTMAEIPALFHQRPMIERHSKAALYHPFIEALALTLVDIPMTFAIQIVFSVIIYFLVGLQQSASQFLYVPLSFFLHTSTNSSQIVSSSSCEAMSRCLYTPDLPVSPVYSLLPLL